MQYIVLIFAVLSQSVAATIAVVAGPTDWGWSTVTALTGVAGLFKRTLTRATQFQRQFLEVFRLKKQLLGAKLICELVPGRTDCQIRTV